MVLVDTVLPFVGILVGLVILHEFGHFVVAKLAGVRVEEFGIGMPPRIWGIRFGETLYSINWLPIGGFVRLTGEQTSQVYVSRVNSHSAAERAGLRPGDVIAQVEDADVHTDEQLAAHVRKAAAAGPIALLIRREEATDGGTELVDYDLVLPVGAETTAASALAEPTESPDATIGRLLGVGVEPDPRALGSKSRPVRIAVMAAGAAVNAVLPIVLFAVAALIPQDVPAGPAVIASVVPGAPAEAAGLQSGDRILEIGGTPVRNTTDVSREINLNLGNDIEFVVERTVQEQSLSQQLTSHTEILRMIVHARLAPEPRRYTVQPGDTIYDAADALEAPLAEVQDAVFGPGIELPKDLTLRFPDGATYVTENGDTVTGLSRDLLRRQSQIIAASGLDFVTLEPGSVVELPQGATGIRISNSPTGTVEVSEGFFAAIGQGWERTVDTMVLLRNRIRSWIAGGEGIEFAGPIGIARTTGEVVEQAGWIRLIELAALLSLNLAIINILPLPMLDGGRIMFVLIEIARRGKRISPEKEGLVHLTGFALFIVFVIVVSYFDILRALSGESALR